MSFFMMIFFCWGAIHGMGASLVVDDIETQGITILTPLEIQECVKQPLGKDLNKQKVTLTEERLQQIYFSKGYEQVKIETQFVLATEGHKNTLKITVEEGKPVRISTLVFHSDLNINFLQVSILKAHMPYDVSQIEETKIRLKEFLVNSEYMAPNVYHLMAPDEEKKPDETASRWVKIDFYVNAGDRVNFGFFGNQFFTYAELLKFVASQRVLNLGQDYVSVVEAYIEEQYKEKGFLQVHIEPFILEPDPNTDQFRMVNYTIIEGPRVHLDSLYFEGNIEPFTQEELSDLFFENAVAMIQNGFYSKNFSEKAAEAFIQKLKEKGYLSVSLYSVTPLLLEDEKTPRVRLYIGMHLGNQSLIQSFSVEGNTVFTTDKIREAMEVSLEEPLNLFSFAENLKKIKTLYLNAGYLDFEIRNEGQPTLIQYQDHNRAAHIKLEVQEGPLSILDTIEVVGYERTKWEVIARCIQIHENDVLKDDALKLTEEKLRRLNIFSLVEIQVTHQEKEPYRKIVHILLEESDRGTLLFGPGLRNDLGIRFFSQFSFANIWGENHSTIAVLNLNRRLDSSNLSDKTQFLEGQAQFSYVWPMFAGLELTARPVITAGQTKYVNFSAQNVGAEIIFERILVLHPLISTQMGYSMERFNQFNASSETENGLLTFGTLSPRLSFDNRDNSLSPTKGFFSFLWIDWSPVGLGTEAKGVPLSLYRLQVRVDAHFPIRKTFLKRCNVYLSVRSGIERATVGEIPLIKLFSLGGVNSLRGFAEQGITFQNYQMGQVTYVNYRVQMDFPIASSFLKWAFFTDAGNLLVNEYSLTSQLYVSMGTGFRYVTPLGPLSIDFSVPLFIPPVLPDGSNLLIKQQFVSFSVGVI